MGLFDWLKPKAKARPKPVPKYTPPVAPVVIPADPLPIPDAALSHRRTAWLWQTAAGIGKPKATRLGGQPLMGADEGWPSCQDCKNPLSFQMQCNLDELPDGAADYGNGVLRLFYCAHDACGGMGGWDAFDPQHSLSILRTKGELRAAPDGTIVHPDLNVTHWKAVDDYPHGEDVDIDWGGNYDYPQQGHKFGGWPAWYQGPERPQCPECKSTMEPLIQLVDYADTGFNYGGGTGHVSQCPKHRDVLAFGWACG